MPTNKPMVHLVDDDQDTRALLKLWLHKDGYDTREFGNAIGFLEKVEKETPHVVILDLKMPGLGGIEALQRLHDRKIETSVIILTASNQAQDAFQAVKLGAYDYLVKPIEKERFLASVRNAAERQQLVQKVKKFESEIQDRYQFKNIIGSSEAMERVFQDVRKVSHSSIPIYLHGDSGTGKELIARAVHYTSSRRTQPFVPINCAAIPEGLSESEFFGHEKGSFSGASGTRKGCFERAHGGTLFLDEIGEMDLSMQVKLLRVLQERTLVRVGGSKTIEVDVRVVCASNKDLEQMIRDGRFREDLYYRLAGYTIHLPALRDRKEDIPLLIQFFINKYRHENANVTIEGLSPEALEVLQHYHWPGNVRELENVVHSLIVTTETPVIHTDFIPRMVTQRSSESQARTYVKESSSRLRRPGLSEPSLLDEQDSGEIITLQELEKQAILRALRITRGKVDVAARKLGISRATLYRRLAEYED
jgi:DNA-binding NtrC family response regulator